MSDFFQVPQQEVTNQILIPGTLTPSLPDSKVRALSNIATENTVPQARLEKEHTTNEHSRKAEPPPPPGPEGDREEV